MTTFTGKTFLVTGAGRGIGKRFALGFSRAGAHVGLMARSKPELDLATLEIEHGGGTALALRADVRDAEAVKAAVDRLLVQFKSEGVDVLICAAGVPGPIGPFATNDCKDWLECVQTDLFGSVNACKAVLPGMLARRRGKILLLSGEGAETARPNFSAYATAKAGLVRFAETLSVEVAESNIQVNCIEPGNTYTSMTDEILKAADLAGDRETEIASRVRNTGGILPDKQIQLAQFLASDHSNHITGKLIDVKDNWRKLEHGTIHSEAYTLRRMLKV